MILFSGAGISKFIFVFILLSLANIYHCIAARASKQPLPAARGISIPLPPRSHLSLLTRSDGTFDHDRAIVQSVITRNKHRQNLINLKKNTGTLPKGMEIKPLASIPADVQARLNLNGTHARRQASEALTPENGNSAWDGPVEMGSSGQNFLIHFDTGSADLWVPSIRCTSPQCAQKTKFDFDLSSTWYEQDGTFEIQYADGSSVSGPIFTDIVSVADIAVYQTFSAVDTLSSAFAQEAQDGTMGLAYPVLSELGVPSYFITAYDDGLLPSAEFGFFYSTQPNESELYLGGTNSQRYTGNLEYHYVDASTGFWQIGQASVGFANGTNSTVTVLSGFDTIIDSGTSIIYGPPGDVESFYSQIPNATAFDSQEGYYSFPCDNTPEVSFSWGGKSFSMTQESFILGLTATGSSDCVGTISGLDVGLGDGTWLIGDVFMRNVYTAFNFELNAVGFADLLVG